MPDKVRRVVTGHTTEGVAIFTSDEAFATTVIPSGDAAFAKIWTTATVPADYSMTKQSN